jgi:hypothetical protein
VVGARLRRCHHSPPWNVAREPSGA